MGRWMALVGAVVTLMGCASTPPELPEKEYAVITQEWVTLQRCIHQGTMPPELGALGEGLINSYIMGHSRDTDRIEGLTQYFYSSTPSVDQGTCNMMAAAIAGRKQQIDSHNTQVDQNRQALQNQINQINQNRPVICNRVGTYTMCQ